MIGWFLGALAAIALLGLWLWVGGLYDWARASQHDSNAAHLGEDVSPNKEKESSYWWSSES